MRAAPVFLLCALWMTACRPDGTDPCDKVDCSLHGACRAVGGLPVCDCDPGFVALGLVCHPDWCAELACVHGSCIQNAELGACQCEAGWGGERCDRCAAGYHLDNGDCLPDLPCDGDPCIHGRCRVEGDAEICDCDAGYTGEVCDRCADGYHPEGLLCIPDEPDPCHPNPCSEPHRSQCTVVGELHECSCDPGFHDEGGVCAPDITDPCVPNPCTQPNRTVCEAAGDAHLCHCDSGYHLEDDACVPDGPDPCEPNPCTAPHRGVCEPAGDDYLCRCDAGYTEEGDACLPACSADADLCAAAHPSFTTLVSANGHGAIGYDIAARKADAFLEHVYRNWDEGVWTRDLLYDSYLGLRAPGIHTWLNQVEPAREEYLEETGIIHVVHQVGDLRVDTYLYSPWEIDRPAMVLAGTVTNQGTSGLQASLYTLHNYHLGNTSPQDPVNPDFADERVQFRPASGAYVETGPGGLLFHRPLGAATRHGCSPDNPWQALNSDQDLADTADSGIGDDRVAGFQKDFDLAPGESGWFGVVTVFDRAGNELSAATDTEAAFGSRTADQVLAEALDGWEAWRAAPPAGLSPDEIAVFRQSEAVLRQGQVHEGSDLSRGQIVASLPPGNWNICWMRDMAYAIVALARSGHLQEARDALAFVIAADTGYFEQDYVGVPYQVTVTRYFGRGKEESDVNADGPNIEFDGFGLFLWALGEYLDASGDTELVDASWSIVRDEIADALLALVDAETGLVSADSSIWEVHWNGNQKRYTYTSLAASRGLCAAASLAASRGDDALAGQYRAAATALRDALRTRSVDAGGVLASSYEELLQGAGYHDMASVEAFGWLLFHPAGQVAAATLDSFEDHLRVASGRGFFRNDDGGWYDSQEWVFVDLRASVGNRLAGRTQVADRLLGWITAQALENHGMIAELHEPVLSGYEGEVPMVGFGAGAYVLALLEREDPRPVEPACGEWETP